MTILRFASGDQPIDRYSIGMGGGPSGAGGLGVVETTGVQGAGSAAGAGLLDAAAATLQISDDGITYRAMLRGDTGAAITALTATNVPVAPTGRYIKCTAGSATIRSLIRA